MIDGFDVGLSSRFVRVKEGGHNVWLGKLGLILLSFPLIGGTCCSGLCGSCPDDFWTSCTRMKTAEVIRTLQSDLSSSGRCASLAPSTVSVLDYV